MSYDHAAFIASIAMMLSLTKLRRIYSSCVSTLDNATEVTNEDASDLLLVKALTEKLQMVERSERSLKQRVITLEREMAHSSLLLLTQTSMTKKEDARAEVEALVNVLVKMKAEELKLVQSNDSLKQRVISLEQELSLKTIANRVLTEQMEAIVSEKTIADAQSNDSLKRRVITLEQELSLKTTANRVLSEQMEALGREKTIADGQVNTFKEADKPSNRFLEDDRSLVLKRSILAYYSNKKSRIKKTFVNPIIINENENTSNQILVEKASSSSSSLVNMESL